MSREEWNNPGASDPIIRQIVDRCHVGDSYLAVVRYLISRLRNGYRTFKQLNRDTRRDVLRQTIAQHDLNREVYHYVANRRRMKKARRA